MELGILSLVLVFYPFAYLLTYKFYYYFSFVQETPCLMK